MASVLIVEDDLLIAEDLKYKLRRLGHEVIAHATTGESAVQQAMEAKPDVVLMDVQLPGGMNGVEAARRIRGRLSVPVVYITADASAMSGNVQEEEQFFVSKPFTVGQLASVISSALSWYEAATLKRV